MTWEVDNKNINITSTLLLLVKWVTTFLLRLSKRLVYYCSSHQYTVNKNTTRVLSYWLTMKRNGKNTIWNFSRTSSIYILFPISIYHVQWGNGSSTIFFMFVGSLICLLYCSLFMIIYSYYSFLPSSSDEPFRWKKWSVF